MENVEIVADVKNARNNKINFVVKTGNPIKPPLIEGSLQGTEFVIEHMNLDIIEPRLTIESLFEYVREDLEPRGAKSITFKPNFLSARKFSAPEKANEKREFEQRIVSEQGGEI